MPEIIINGTPVLFPHENPYSVQKTYMEKVIECLRDSKNGVLESPTGTGKTLSLLCSSLAWLQQQKAETEVVENSATEKLIDTLVSSGSNSVPKIIYASRTHTQLTQAIKELKGTDYNHVKTAVLASRDQLCIHPDLTFESNANKTEMCKSKIKKLNGVNQFDRSGQILKCSFYEGFKTLNIPNDANSNKILDIEDLVSAGRQHHHCPYYRSKELVKDADIVFMPYNYLLDPKIRNFIGVDLEDAVIILDEAHNVPHICEESASIEFKSSHISDAIQEVAIIANLLTEFETSNFNESELIDLSNILKRFKTAVDEIQISSLNGNSLSGKEFDGDFIFAIMDKADIGYHTSVNINSLIRSMLEYLSDCVAKRKTQASQSATTQHSQPKISQHSPGLRKFSNILWTTFAKCGEDFRDQIKKHYRVYVVWESFSNSQISQSTVPGKIINYWCFSPKFGLEFLLERKRVRSIIFTSGTMSPLEPFIKSLGIPIQVKLQNTHIIDKSQVLVEIISNGSDGELLASTFKNRNNPKYLQSLGDTIFRLSQVVPDGLLIFFPSYQILNMCTRNWQTTGIWNEIQQSKPIFVEPQTKEVFVNTMKNYYKQINDPAMAGAIFMAVCRGKVSEGLDFADINGRAVIITGLPFPPLWDPKIRLKRNYMELNRSSGSLSGDQWYSLEAARAVNQAIGRVIRHKNDYGAILLCDHRFKQPTQTNQLSLWIRNHLKCESSTRSFDSVINSVTHFFRSQQMIKPSTEANCDINIALQNRNQRSPETSFNTQLVTSNRVIGVTDSPMTACINRIAILPLSSPLPSTSSSANISASVLLHSPSPSTSPRINISDNGTPNKQKCIVNLSQRFIDEI